MYKALYQVSSMYPYYYSVIICYCGKECTRLITGTTCDTWEDLERYARSYSAELVFDGII